MAKLNKNRVLKKAGKKKPAKTVKHRKVLVKSKTSKKLKKPKVFKKIEKKNPPTPRQGVASTRFAKAPARRARQRKTAINPVKKNTIKKVKQEIKHIKPVIKKIEKEAVKKNIPNEEKAPFAAESLFKTRIKVIGIGGGGGSIVSEIGRSLEKASFVIADTDIRALKKRSGVKYFWFGEEQTHGLGTGADPDLAKRAAEIEKEKMAGLFKDQDIVVLIASLGGGLGSGATKIFADAASSSGAITLGIFTLPFKFEGKNKTRIAQKAIKDLKNSLNISITIPNEKIFKIIDANTPITEAFSIVNKNLIESLESLIDLIYNPGVINIDFADLRTILKGRGSTAFLNTVEELGKNRADKIAEKILYNPLYQNTSFAADKILFNISGGNNLSMFEVEKISRTISNSNPKAKIIFGISKNTKLKNKIKTTILMTGSGVQSASIINDKEKSETKVKEIKTERKKKAEKTFGRSPTGEPTGKAKRKAKKQTVEIPVFGKESLVNELTAPNKLNISAAKEASPPKKTIRRSALEVKEAQELEENKRLMQEKEWEIPAFLRKVKFKN